MILTEKTRTRRSQTRFPGMPGAFVNRLLLLCLLLVLTGGGQAQNSSISLPDIGDPASAILSPAQERELGKALLSQIRRNLNLVKDPELNTYVQSLGTRLLTTGIGIDIDFAFLMVDSTAINAFAAPGGIVAINSGLLTASASEAELAAVMAHEIAHVTQRHLARTYANASNVNVSTALGVLAAVVAGLYSNELGQAALYSSLAAGASSQLAFTRTNETEADNVGIQLLANAGFDPHGMPAFLTRLHRATQLSIGNVPEFLSTHPVTLSRIADTRSRAESFDGDFRKDSEQFRYTKARAVALSKEPVTTINDYERVQRSGGRQTDTDTYSYAIALTRAGYTDHAIEVLAELQLREVDSVAVNLALTQAQIKGGQIDNAEQLLRRLNNLYPGQEPIIYYLTEVLIKADKAKEALRIVERQTRNSAHNPELDRLKARAAAEANQLWLSHESNADYYTAYGQYDAALQQFDLALAGDVNVSTRARLESKRKHIVEMTKEK